MATKATDALTSVEVEIVSGLDPAFQPSALRARAAVLAAGIPFTFISGLRSRGQQAALDATAGSPAVAAGTSKHELGFAFDWTGPRNSTEQTRAGLLIQGLGLESGVFYKKPDPNHVEQPGSRGELYFYRAVKVVAVAAMVGLAVAYVSKE
jgi:hypothetical protein